MRGSQRASGGAQTCSLGGGGVPGGSEGRQVGAVREGSGGQLPPGGGCRLCSGVQGAGPSETCEPWMPSACVSCPRRHGRALRPAERGQKPPSSKLRGGGHGGVAVGPGAAVGEELTGRRKEGEGETEGPVVLCQAAGRTADRLK